MKSHETPNARSVEAPFSRLSLVPKTSADTTAYTSYCQDMWNAQESVLRFSAMTYRGYSTEASAGFSTITLHHQPLLKNPQPNLEQQPSLGGVATALASPGPCRHHSFFSTGTTELLAARQKQPNLVPLNMSGGPEISGNRKMKMIKMPWRWQGKIPCVPDPPGHSYWICRWAEFEAEQNVMDSIPKIT